MRFLPGGTLTDIIKKQKQLPVDRLLKILEQVSSALDFAHNEGVIHRDLKPDNILFDAQGNAYLSDFGIARLMESQAQNLTQSGQVVGTPSYMAPEQWLSQTISPRTDVYALGILTYLLLTGTLPFESKTAAA